MMINIYTCTTTGLFHVFPDPNNVSCPSQPCATISDYILNMSGIISISNVKFLFLSGKHNLATNITMQYAHNVTMTGVSYDNTAIAVISCCEVETIIVFINSSNITIANLVFENCGGTGQMFNGFFSISVTAAVCIRTCYYCNVTNVTFIEYGLVISNLLGESYLSDIMLHIDVTEYRLPHPLWYNKGIGLINYGSSPYYISSHSLISVSRITIIGSNNTRKTSFQHDVISIHIEFTDYDTTLILSDCNFHHIYGYCILKVSLLLRTASSRIRMWIKNCKFQYNERLAVVPGAMIQIYISFINVTLFVTNCHFYKNKNRAPVIVVQVISYDEYIQPAGLCSFPSYIQIKYSNFRANESPLVSIYGDKVLRCITHFSMIGPFTVKDNDGFGADLIRIRNAVVNISGKATFSYNLNANNIIFFYSCNITLYKNISFIMNGNSEITGSISQIITLHSGLAYIKVMENTSIKFINNTYLQQAIQVKTDYIPYPFCVFQYEAVTSKNVSYALIKSYSIDFHDGFIANIFVTKHDKASVESLLNDYAFHCQWLPKSIFHGYHPADINQQIIQTDNKHMYQHTRVCYCFMNNTHDCSLDQLGPVFPGQLLKLNLCIPNSDDGIFALYVDTFNKFLPTSACKVAHQNQLINTISSSLKTYNLTIVSESRHECELFLTAQPDLYKRYDIFYVQLLPCPIGFTLQNGKCDCDPILSTIIDQCYVDYSTIRRPANSWIVALTQTNNTKYLISSCPMDYCLPYSSSVNLLYPDLQCQFNRTGMLCSQCQHPLSMVFGSSRCMKCTNVHILITFIVLVAGIVLVVLLYVLNLTVTNGTINGMILYANIVSINDSVFLINDNVFKPLRVFISFTNLDLGIETCFYDGMDSYSKMWLQLFFPSYLIIIATSIIITSRYSTRILRLTYTRSLPILATLFLLSYTGVLRTVLTVLFSYSTITHLPSDHQELVWSIDASVPLFGLKFTILFITCLVLFLLLIPFNITLLFTRFFLRFKMIYRFKPLLDAFQGSYKDKYYYWVAVHLAMRSLLFTFYALPTQLKPILSTMLLIVFGIYSGYACPYKSKLVNIQELLLLTNLAILYTVSHQGNTKVFSIINNVLIGSSFMQSCAIVSYHFLTYTCHCDIDVLRMLNRMKQKLIPLHSKRRLNNNSNNIALLNIPECTYNYAEYRDGLISDDFI